MSGQWWDSQPGEVDRNPEKVAEWDYVLATFAGVPEHGWHRAECPRCLELDAKTDKKKSFGYNAATGGYNCFKCGMHGRLPEDVQRRLHGDDEDLPQVRKPVAEPEKKGPSPAYGYTPLFEEPGWSSALFDFARDYLTRPKSDRKGRALDVYNLAEARVGAALTGYLGGRIIVPIPDYANPDGPWKGWVARDATGFAERPYLYPKGMDRLGVLYNEPALYVETDVPCFIVEGTLDTLALWPDAVAVLGKPLESQKALFLKAKRPLIVCLDGDAWQEGLMLSTWMRFCGLRAGNIRLAPGVDPDEVPRSWLDEQAQRALR